MSMLTNLPPTTNKKNKRLGRGLGSGKGAKAARGIKRHQKAREKIKIWFEGGQNRTTKKFPLLRGKGKNKSVRPTPIPVNLTDLSKLPEKSTVDISTLIKNNIVDKKALETGVKILSEGEVSKPLTIALPISKKARKKIEAGGGKIIE